jgi:hypothetical protein
MNIQAIRNGIVAGLYNHLQKPVIMAEQAENKPTYPYLSYKFIVPYNPDTGRGIEVSKLIPSDNPDFEYDFEETKIQQPTMTISFTAYSLDSLESQELALKAREWMDHIGYYDLKRLGVVVVSVEAMGNRDTLIVDEYERKVGFDVIIRVVHEVKRRLETIEEVNLNKESE